MGNDHEEDTEQSRQSLPEESLRMILRSINRKDSLFTQFLQDNPHYLGQFRGTPTLESFLTAFTALNAGQRDKLLRDYFACVSEPKESAGGDMFYDVKELLPPTKRAHLALYNLKEFARDAVLEDVNHEYRAIMQNLVASLKQSCNEEEKRKLSEFIEKKTRSYAELDNVFGEDEGEISSEKQAAKREIEVNFDSLSEGLQGEFETGAQKKLAAEILTLEPQFPQLFCLHSGVLRYFVDELITLVKNAAQDMPLEKAALQLPENEQLIVQSMLAEGKTPRDIFNSLYIGSGKNQDFTRALLALMAVYSVDPSRPLSQINGGRQTDGQGLGGPGPDIVPPRP